MSYRLTRIPDTGKAEGANAVSQDLVSLLPSFELHLRAEAKSPKTVRIYRAAVLQFVGWLQKEHPDVVDWDAVMRDHLREWSIATIERTSPATPRSTPGACSSS